MRKSFTLIEIVITVMLISIIGFALLQMQSNTIRSLELLDKRLKVNKYSSFIFSTISKNLHKKNRTVYEFIKDRYIIDDDDVIRYLKEKEYVYTQDEMFFLNFGENEDGETEMEMQSSAKDRDSEDIESSEAIKKNGVLVERVSIRDENNNSTSLYHFSYLK